MGTLVRVNMSGSQKGTRINLSKEEGVPGGGYPEETRVTIDDCDGISGSLGSRGQEVDEISVPEGG